MTHTTRFQTASVIGAPTDIGAGTRGASMGPEALRVAGLIDALARLGLDVQDCGNLQGPANPWAPAVNGFRHLDEVALWNVADNQKVVLRQPSEKYALFNIRQLLFTPDGKSLLYFDQSDEKTHIWDVAAPEETGTMDGGQLMAVAGDGSRLAWIGDTDEGGKAVFVAAFADPDNVTKLFDLDPERKVTPTIAFLYFTPDGEQLVLGGLFAGELNNAIYIIDVR